jgi:hypothetical protein
MTGKDEPEITAGTLLEDARESGRRSYRKKIGIPGHLSSGPRSLFNEAKKNGIKLTHKALVDAFVEGWNLEAKENPHPKSRYEQLVESIRWD